MRSVSKGSCDHLISHGLFQNPLTLENTISISVNSFPKYGLGLVALTTHNEFCQAPPSGRMRLPIEQMRTPL